MALNAASSTAWRRTANALKPTVTNSEGREFIQLRGLPRTALPQDVWRMIRQANVENVTDIKLDYFHFRPSGRAYLKLSNARFMDSVIPILRRCTFASSRIVANPSPAPSHISMRSRGKKGRAEAEERGVVVGNGAAGGLHVKGCDVMISGLPSRSSSEQMTRYLKRNRLVGETDDGFADCEILQVRVGRMESFTQQFLVRLRTAAEAHALVRRLHLTYCQLASDHGMPVLIRAHVLY